MNEFLSALQFTCLQAFLSAGVSMLLGAVGAMGLWGVAHKKVLSRGLILMAILPNTVPVIFVIFSFLKYVSFAKGFWGIVTIHSFLNAGLVSIAIFELLEQKLSSLAETAWIDNCGSLRFILKVALPILKNDLTKIFFFVFAISFTSFAIPLMVGGSQASTIEVLIFEKIRVATNFRQAFLIASFEVIFLFCISLFLKRRSIESTDHSSKSPVLNFRFGLIVLVLPSLFLLFSLWQSLSFRFSFSDEVYRMMIGSFFISVGSGLATFAILMLLARYRPRLVVRKMFLGFVTPSAAIVGLALLWGSRSTGMPTYFKLMLGLTFMHLPILYRLSWDNQIFSYSKQIEAALIMGAKPQNIFTQIITPQILQAAYNLAGLSALWSFGDFALAAVVAEKNLSLAQMFSHLTETYRWEEAESLLLPMICGGILCYTLFSGVGYVASRSALRRI